LISVVYFDSNLPEDRDIVDTTMVGRVTLVDSAELEAITVDKEGEIFIWKISLEDEQSLNVEVFQYRDTHQSVYPLNSIVLNDFSHRPLSVQGYMLYKLKGYHVPLESDI